VLNDVTRPGVTLVTIMDANKANEWIGYLKLRAIPLDQPF
jgi:hypothetical protein